MNQNTILKGVVCVGLFASLNAAENLGTISVDSSTITGYEGSLTEASTVNFIDGARIEEINPRHINELLQTIPGVSSDVRTGEVVEIHLRGVGQQEFMWEDTGVAIIVDGVPIWQNGGKFRLNMSDIKSIKVIKGGASYLYGNTALAGAVIITTSKPRGGSAYSVNLEAGSHNYKDVTATLTKSSQNYALNLNANYRDTDGYWVDSALWSKAIGGRFSYYIDDTSDITFGGDLTKKYEQKQRGSTTGVIEAETNPKGTGRNSFQKENYVDLEKYFLTYSKSFENDSNLMVNVYDYFDKYDYISSPQDTTGDGENDTYTNHSNQDIEQKGIKLEYRQEGDAFAYMVGLEHAQRNYESASRTLADYNSTSRGQTTYYYEGEQSQTQDEQTKNAVYGEVKYEILPKLAATFNLRHDIQKDEYDVEAYRYDETAWKNTQTKRDKTFYQNSYRVGATYALFNETALYANVSTGFRTPTVDQLYAGDVKGGTYVNNEGIKVQKTVNYEIGIKGRQLLLERVLRYEASIFQTDNKDIIGKKDGTYYTGDENYYDNIGDAKNYGFELSLIGDLLENLSFSLAYTYLDSEYTKHNPFKISYYSAEDGTYDIVGNDLPRISHHTTDFYLTYKATEDLKIISEIYAKSDYYADETNQITMPGYALLNLHARYSMTIGGTNLELYAKVNNLFDKQYYRTVFMTNDRNNDNIFDAEDATITVDPGREFYAGLNYRF